MTTNDWHTHAVQSAAAGAGPATPDLGFDDRSLGRGFTPDPDPDALTGDLAALTRVLLGVADVVDKEEPAPAADLVDVTGLGVAGRAGGRRGADRPGPHGAVARHQRPGLPRRLTSLRRAVPPPARR